jgi:hypothetical protein
MLTFPFLNFSCFNDFEVQEISMLSNFRSGQHFLSLEYNTMNESETRGNEDNCSTVYMSEL